MTSWWCVLSVLVAGCVAHASAQAQRSITKHYFPPLQTGDVITITGTGYPRSVGLIRLHSEVGSCDTVLRLRSINGQDPSTCNPLVMKLLTRRHKVRFFKKDMDANNKDVFMLEKGFPGLMSGIRYKIIITVTYTGYDVRLNDGKPIGFITRGKMGKVTMIRATSGLYSHIGLKRGKSIPLNEPNCGLRGSASYRSKWARITNGQNADPGAYPWQVSLRRKKVYPWSPFPHMCGGSLVGKCWVVTAAHCVSHVARHKKNYEIRAGDYHNGDNENFKLEEDQQTFDIKEVYIHESFKNKPVPSHDIALLKLKEKNGTCARYSKFVNSVCLPVPDSDSFSLLKECHITGWGAKNWTDLPRDYPHILQFGKVLLRDFDNCQNKYGRDPSTNITRVREGMLCAGSPGIDTCQGDSGGPLVCQREGPNILEEYPFVLWGITSWGHGCADTNKPGVYTDVSRYIDWIMNVRAGVM